MLFGGFSIDNNLSLFKSTGCRQVGNALFNRPNVIYIFYWLIFIAFFMSFAGILCFPKPLLFFQGFFATFSICK